jgi:hypothetical protein
MAATSSGRPGRPIAIFAKIRAAKPDVVIGGVAASDLTTFLKQWNELGMKGKIPFAEISVGNTDLWGFGLDSDVVFGVKDSLIRDFVLHLQDLRQTGSEWTGPMSSSHTISASRLCEWHDGRQLQGAKNDRD